MKVIMNELLTEIIGLLEPIAGQDWHGKWRIQKALNILRSVDQADALPPTLTQQATVAVREAWRLADKISASEADTERMIAESVLKVSQEFIPQLWLEQTEHEFTREQLGKLAAIGRTGIGALRLTADLPKQLALVKCFCRLEEILTKLESAKSREISIGFDEWCASVKDCGYEVQPNSATARQRKLGWDAAMATKREIFAEKPTEEMCHRARGFILGLDLGVRKWGNMKKHLEMTGALSLPYIEEQAAKDPEGHITKWDLADCIYQLMNTKTEIEGGQS